MMLRSKRKNLSCFYCGRKSDVHFGGQSSFNCKYCEATNWLDEKGGITDPPATSSTPEKPASSASVQRGVVSHNSIFCARCQRNQEIVAAGLREFQFPDDIDGPEYATRTKEFRAWRKNFESRYPQVCADCEPRVREQLQKASYTAKTDHLRRMMDRTRERRRQTQQKGFLDYVDLIGHWTWHLAFFCQFLWHALVLAQLYVEHGSNQDSTSWMLLYLQKSGSSILKVLPPSERLIRWVINLSFLSFVWNPRFKQTIRGFTSHILGFRQWYTYQIITILIRCACLFIAQYIEAKSMPILNQLGAQLTVAWMTLYIYKMAQKSIRTDTTPLFGSRSQASIEEREAPTQSHDNDNDLGVILDDILKPPAGHEPRPSVAQSSQRSVQRPLTSRNDVMQSGPFGAEARSKRPDISFGALNLSESLPSQSPPLQPPVQYSDEMDWSPSGSQHRAFGTHNPYKVKNPNPRFNDTPIEPKPGPFWYKVPPAPTNPAQRLRNPPMKPIIRESPKETTRNFFQNGGKKSLDLGSSATTTQNSDFSLRDPQFYAPGPLDDPRDGLSNMMGSFSISPDPEVRPAAAKLATSGHLSGLPNRSRGRTAEMIVLLTAFWAWLSALSTDELYAQTLGLGAACACLMISIRLAIDLFIDAEIKEGMRYSIFRPTWPSIRATLGIAQAIVALVFVWRVWAGNTTGPEITCGAFGNAFIGVMVVHQVWHVFA